MKKHKYTAKQIRNAIAHWQHELGKFDSFNLNESTSELISTFENIFGDNVVYSQYLDFFFNDKNKFQIFDILNKFIFENKLKYVPINVISQSKMANTKIYGEYWRNIKRINKWPMVKVSNISINVLNSGMTFAFAVSCLCHEMIHYYVDITTNSAFDEYVAYMVGDKYDAHNEYFERKMDYANTLGLNVMKTHHNEQFDRLNIDAAKQMSQYDNNIIDIIESLKDMDIHEIAAGIKKNVTAGGGEVCVEVIDDDTIRVGYP